MILVPVINDSSETVKLGAQLEIGYVASVDGEDGDLSVNVADEAGVSCDEEEVSGAVSTVVASPALTASQRQEKLRAILAKSGSPATEEMIESVLSYHHVFSLEENEKGALSGVEHVIKTSNHPPIKQSPHRVPFALRKQISDMVQDMLRDGIIQESASPWTSPVVMVRKKDGTMRFCVDYRRLNAITRKDVFPLPRIDDLLEQLSGKYLFSTFDAHRGYWQIPVSDDSRPKTAFATHEGLYEFRVMPFGLCNAPATFQRLMQRILSGMNSFCNVYIDDILIFSRNPEEHQEHLEQVFRCLEQYGLKLHPDKCQLARAEVEYLGHIVSGEGIRPNPAKVLAVESIPAPTNVRTVREFLGLCSYYRKFVPDFTKIASPLHHLLRSNVKFEWTEQCQASFQRLKDLLVTPPVLVYPNFDKSFILHTDASGNGLGAVLEQEQDDGTSHPVAYASRSLSKHERRYGITELEALAIVWALKYCKAYLWGHRCTVYTDHAPATTLLGTKHSSGKLARWREIVAEFDLEIRYRPGRRNANADTLSRSPGLSLPDDPSLEIVQVAVVGADTDVSTNSSTDPAVSTGPNASTDQDMVINPELAAKEDLIKLQQEDPDLSAVIITLQGGTPQPLVKDSSKFVLVNGVLHFCGDKVGDRLRICVPKVQREELMRSLHEGTFAGHFSHRALYNALSKGYWWKGMYRDAQAYCRGCLTCATYQGAGRKMKPPLMPVPVGGPFTQVGVDIMELPLTVHGNRYVIIFLDYLTKWVEAYAAPDQTSETIATLLVNEVVCRHGVPEVLISDRRSNLLSALMREVCALTGIKKINTTAYHPQADGLVENCNRTLKAMLAKHSEVHNTNWDEHLPKLLFAYRTKCHDTTKESPIFLVYGRDARVPCEEALSFEKSPYMVDVDDYKTELAASLADAWRITRDNIDKAQKAQKKQYDKKARVKEIRAGDRVMVYMPQEANGVSKKLARPHFGPYRVLDVHPNGLTVRPVDRPKDPSIRVNLERATLCPPELPDESWLGNKRRRRKSPK